MPKKIYLELFKKCPESVNFTLLKNFFRMDKFLDGNARSDD